MSNNRAIKQRIKSAKNISKITKAMEMVSANKMRRSQKQAISSRPYARSLKEILQKVSQHTSPESHPLLAEKSVRKSALVIISTDRGLVGGLNANLFRSVVNWSSQVGEFEVITIGKKANIFARKMGMEIYADFSDLPENLSYSDTLPISQLIMDAFLKDEFQHISIVFMRSINALSQQSVLTQLLPITATDIDNPAELVSVSQEYTFEPNPQAILNWLLPYYIENIIFFSLIEAKASEHSARMISMKNASDNAGEIMGALSLVFNRSRQAGITQELQEITTAQMSL